MKVTRVAAETVLSAGMAMGMFVGMSTHGSLMWTDLEGEELNAFQLFRELGWAEYTSSTSRFSLTKAGVAAADRAQEAAKAAMRDSLIASALGEG